MCWPTIQASSGSHEAIRALCAWTIVMLICVERCDLVILSYTLCLLAPASFTMQFFCRHQGAIKTRAPLFHHRRDTLHTKNQPLASQISTDLSFLEVALLSASFAVLPVALKKSPGCDLRLGTSCQASAEPRHLPALGPTMTRRSGIGGRSVRMFFSSVYRRLGIVVASGWMVGGQARTPPPSCATLCCVHHVIAGQLRLTDTHIVRLEG